MGLKLRIPGENPESEFIVSSRSGRKRFPEEVEAKKKKVVVTIYFLIQFQQFFFLNQS
jgi:hypothetical protein